MASAELAVTNACVVDGSGREPFSGTVLVADGVVAEVFERGDALPAGVAGEVFDAGGAFLAPGFIDCHGHSDISILASPEAFGKISQGITTEVVGNCGLSPFPVTELNRKHLQGLFGKYRVGISWNSAADYAAAVNMARPAINIASLTGHNTLRASVRGYRAGTASKREIRAMADALSGGSSLTAGFSSGLLYVPGESASEEELVALVRANSAAGGVYASHLRGEGDSMPGSLEEFFRVAGKGGAERAHVSHLKVAGRRNWNKLDAVLDMIEGERSKGLQVTADVYPYTESMTQLSVILPNPWSRMGDVELEELLTDPMRVEELAKALEREIDAERWRSLRLVATTAEIEGFDAEAARGDVFPGAAETAGVPPWKLCAELLAADASGTTVASSGISRENMERIVSAPWVCCCTDETARPVDYSLGYSHPRGFGAFPEFLKTTGRLEIPLGEAVRRMTSLPASVFRLAGRGMIRRGARADMVLFDLERLSSDEPADFASPHRINSGIRRVWVGGKASYADGEVVGRYGRFVSQADTPPESGCP